MSNLRTIIEQGLEPDLIDEVSENLTYIGYLKPGTDLCLIKRIQKTDTVTTFMYPHGHFDFAYDWAERADYNYAHKR